MGTSNRPSDIEWLIDNQTDEISGYMVRGKEFGPPVMLRDDGTMYNPGSGADIPLSSLSMMRTPWHCETFRQCERAAEAAHNQLPRREK
jgi:hypothetical protein